MQNQHWIKEAQEILPGEFNILLDTFGRINRSEVNEIKYDILSGTLENFVDRILKQIKNISSEPKKESSRGDAQQKIINRLEELNKFSQEIPYFYKEIVGLQSSIPRIERTMLYYDGQYRMEELDRENPDIADLWSFFECLQRAQGVPAKLLRVWLMYTNLTIIPYNNELREKIESHLMNIYTVLLFGNPCDSNIEQPELVRDVIPSRYSEYEPKDRALVSKLLDNALKDYNKVVCKIERSFNQNKL